MAGSGKRGAAARGAIVLSMVALCGLFASAQGRSAAGAQAGVQVPADVRARANRDGRVRVLVELRLPSGRHVAEAALPPQAAEAQRRAIETQAARVLARVSATGHRVLRQYRTVPFVALEVSPAALAALENAPDDVARVMEDALLRPVLAQSAPLVQADQAWDVGYDGTGTVIAVLDTGVDAQHPFLAGKIAEEACFSSTVAGLSQSVCPNGQDEQTGAGSAAPCGLSGCLHGTHVAGIAAGTGASFSGVAKGASIFAVQVFSEITDAESCGGIAPCAAAFSADVIAALEHVYTRAGAHNLVAANMSLGGNLFTEACDTEPYKPAIDNLRGVNVASIVASGNSGSPWSIATPSCISTAVSVGATDKDDNVAWFSNAAPILTLFAPGQFITSSVPGGGFAPFDGTSMAAPHVAGAWAILRQARPSFTVSTLLSALQNTGKPVTDTRFFGTVTVPRVQMFEALAAIKTVVNPAPTATAVSPERVRAGTGPATFTVTGTGFNAFSIVLWNGAPQPSNVVDTRTIEATVPGDAFATVGQAQIAVFTPGPGGGTSASLPVTIDPPPTLTVSTQAANPGMAVTVTLQNGFGGSRDWLAFAATSMPDNNYLNWTYVGSGVTTRTWTVNMPSSAGTYEFRLFQTGNSTVVATSPVVTVAAQPNPVPALSALSPAASVEGGQAFTLTATGSGFVSSSVVRWNGEDRPTTFVNGTTLRAAIGEDDLTQPGTAQVSVFSPAPGGGLSNPKPFSIGEAPTITVSATTAATGENVTATMTNGVGGFGDWLALAVTGSPNTSYLKYTYVGAGNTTKVWTVSMPATPGTYEFRLFGGGYVRLATSPTVTVVQGANPVPALTSLSPSIGALGGPAFTLTLNGSGFAASSVARWNGADRPTTFVSSTQLRASIPASDLAVEGTAQVTVFSPAPGGGLSASRAFTIGQAPELTVSATSVAPGATVTVTLTNGLGGAGDWIALAATSAPNNSYIRYTYVGGGITTKSWTFTMPTTPGTYEFRLFLNNGYTRAATSPAIVVQ